MQRTAHAFYDRYIEREQHALDKHRIALLARMYDATSRDVLDIGCGNGEVLELLRSMSAQPFNGHGLDLGASVVEKLRRKGLTGCRHDAGEPLPYADGSFDTVVCSEVIEHIVDVDRLVCEARRVLRPGGALLLTTPNLAYLANRVLLLLGIQPFFTETSLEMKLGRRFRILGQGEATQGHLKIFTLGSLCELLQMHRFQIVKRCGYPYFVGGPLAAIDRAIATVPSIAAGFVVKAVPAE
jgi:SAM-dependent methyltransferase